MYRGESRAGVCTWRLNLLEINGWSKKLSAAVVPKLPVDVLISWTEYMSVDETSSTTSLVVVMRSQKRKQIQGMRAGTVELLGNGRETVQPQG